MKMLGERLMGYGNVTIHLGIESRKAAILMANLELRNECNEDPL